MKNYKALSVGIIALLMIPFFATTVYANSSWRWISETRPYDVLPWVILMTLAIEICAITFIAKVKNVSKTICFVAVANIFSFAAPYLLLIFYRT